VPSRAGTYTCHAQFESNALWNIRPVEFVMENVRQAPSELPCSSDSGGGVEAPMQLVSRSSRRGSEQ